MRHLTKTVGRNFNQLIGSRAQVWHGTAYKTTGGLTKSDLMMSHGRIVSVKKHNTAKREKRLEKAGYFTRKGKFGFVRKSAMSKRRSSLRSSRGGGVDDEINEQSASAVTVTTPNDIPIGGRRRKRSNKRGGRGSYPLQPASYL
jgi:hypothetical protein